MGENALIEAMAMMAENMQRLAAGESPAYSEQAFRDLIDNSGVERLQAELDAAKVEIERLKGVPTDNGFKTAPARYTQQDRETIDRIRDKLGDEGFAAFCVGTEMRYDDRRGAKGDPDGDNEKARWFRMMAAHVAGEGPDPRADRPGFVPYKRIGGE